MLAAAPESNCGAVMHGACDFKLAAAGGSEIVLAEDATVELSNRVCWASLAGGIYSVAGVSSREVEKCAPMPVAFSAAEIIH